MKLSIIIPYAFGGDPLRLQALENLFKSIESQIFKDFEIIVIEELIKVNSVSFPYKNKVNQLIILKDPENRWYNKSWCINVGIKNSNTDNILILDADIMFGKEYFKIIEEFAKTHHKFFYGYNWIILMPGKDNPIVRIRPHSDKINGINEVGSGKMYGIYATGGSWFSNKKFFWQSLGGMNENFFGYGGEDGEMHKRVSYVLGHEPDEIEYPIVHQYHDWHPKNGVNPLNLEYMRNLENITSSNPEKTINKLKFLQLGNIKCPTLMTLK